MRKVIGLAFVVLVLFAGVFVWRVTHPKLTDEEQIAANLDAICAAAGSRSPKSIAYYLAPTFQTGGMKKSAFQNSLAGGILQYRVIDLKLPTSKNVVSGNTAMTDGSYVLSLKSEYDSPAEVQRGKFKLSWQKSNAQWFITAASVDNPLMP